MSQLQVNGHSTNAGSLHDATIRALEYQIAELTKTIALLAADGHLVQYVKKQLDEMTEKLRTMKSRD